MLRKRVAQVHGPHEQHRASHLRRIALTDTARVLVQCKLLVLLLMLQQCFVLLLLLILILITVAN